MHFGNDIRNECAGADTSALSVKCWCLIGEVGSGVLAKGFGLLNVAAAEVKGGRRASY
jgi:hypothetical protein